MKWFFFGQRSKNKYRKLLMVDISNHERTLHYVVITEGTIDINECFFLSFFMHWEDVWWYLSHTPNACYLLHGYFPLPSTVNFLFFSLFSVKKGTRGDQRRHPYLGMTIVAPTYWGINQEEPRLGPWAKPSRRTKPYPDSNPTGGPMVGFMCRTIPSSNKVLHHPHTWT